MSQVNYMTKAKAQLILDHPFFASILLGMTMAEDTSIPTMATDGESIRFNPEWVATLKLNELTFVLAHEVMHCVFQHMTRRNHRDPNKWNIAGDYVINDVLVKERVGAMPHGGLLNPQLVIDGNGTTEGVYNLLPEPPPKQDGSSGDHPGAGQPGGAMDQVMDAGQDQATNSQKEAEMRVRICQARNAAKMAGKLSAGLERLVSDLVQPRVDWRAVLRRFLTTRAKIDLSYARPKRRFLADDLYLPGLTGERLGRIAVAVDCSGSIDDKTLAEFSAEIKAIAEDTQPEAIEIVYFDSEILRRDVFEQGQAVEIHAMGGGGTAFSPIFEALMEVPPIACVVLTDLCCDDFGPAPEYPVLWASTHDGEAPFGEIVLMRDRR
jgi:predicted metal-dependent peptidase